LPLPGWVSILHRVSGAGLFLMLPLLIWLLGLSLGSPESFDTFKSITGHPLVKLILFGLLWAYLHHFCMGIRILLLDVHVGIEKAHARTSAIAVLVVSLALTALLGAKLW
jgi:succinate dehydrogenase / fumarate reductase, cytochrome b subunit